MSVRGSLYALVVAACALAADGAPAVPVSGRIASPSGALPALTLYAWSLSATRLYSAVTLGGEASYRLDLPAGRYYVFAAPADPGAPAIYGAYTEYAACLLAQPREECRQHGLATVVVAHRPLEHVDLSDWYLDAGVTATLDRLLGRPDAAEDADEPDNELAAPRFSEYPAAGAPAATATQLVAGSDPRVERDRPLLVAALAGRPNFAGRAAVVPVGCGGDCEAIAIVDLPSGRVAYPPPLAALPPRTVCRAANAVQYRRDSRLLTVSAPDGAQFTTRYFVWDAEAGLLRQIASLASVSERCVPGR
jgi:hypothetical protein